MRGLPRLARHAGRAQPTCREAEADAALGSGAGGAHVSTRDVYFEGDSVLCGVILSVVGKSNHPSRMGEDSGVLINNVTQLEFHSQSFIIKIVTGAIEETPVRFSRKPLRRSLVVKVSWHTVFARCRHLSGHPAPN